MATTPEFSFLRDIEIQSAFILPGVTRFFFVVVVLVSALGLSTKQRSGIEYFYEGFKINLGGETHRNTLQHQIYLYHLLLPNHPTTPNRAAIPNTRQSRNHDVGRRYGGLR